MCEVTTAIAAASAALSFFSNAAEAVAQSRQADAEIRAANMAYAMDMQAINDRARQIAQTHDLDIFERQRQAAREYSRIAVAAGEAGVGGNSPARLLANTLQQMSYDQGIFRQNKENALAQNLVEVQAAGARRESRIKVAEARRPNPFLTSLKIGGQTAMSFYNTQSTLANLKRFL